MSESFWDKVIEELKTRLQAKSVTAESHPEFYASVKKLAEKAGIKTPHILHAKEYSFGLPWQRKLPNAGAIPGANVVLLNESILNVSGSSLNKAMSPELESVMAHEFSHLKDGLFHTMTGRLSVKLLPLVGLAGLYLYDRAKKKAPRKHEESEKEYATRLQNEVHAAADQEIADSHARGHEIDKMKLEPKWKATVIDIARYTTVAAIGMAAGLGFARFHYLRLEYRADKFAVELTKKPEEFKSILNKLYAEYARAKPPENLSLDQRIKKAHMWVVKHTTHAHPNLKNRLNFIDKIAREGGLGPNL